MSEQPGHMMMVGKVFENIIESNIEKNIYIKKPVVAPSHGTTTPPHDDGGRCGIQCFCDLCSFVVVVLDKNTGRLKNLNSCGLLRCTSQEAATNIGAAFNSSAEDDEDGEDEKDDEDDEHDLY